VIKISTVAQIIEFAEDVYPRVNDKSETLQIMYLNQIMEEINNTLLRVRWENDPYEMYSVADQATYSIPTDCTPDNILKVIVSEEVSTSIDEDTEWNDYTYVGLLDKTDISVGQYYYLENDIIYLFDDGLPLKTTDLVIRLYYFRKPTYISAITDTPEIDSQYHNLLKYGLIQMIASIGDNPDTEIADYWQKKYDEQMTIAMKSIEDKFDNAPLKTKQVDEYW
jgi:hypothetical protein